MSFVVTQDGTRLFYKEWGEGKPVILVHGWPLASDSFDDLMQAIANTGMRAISYDRRGFGRSDQPGKGYDYNTLADDLATLIAHTGASDAALVGFSMGAGEIVRYLSRHGSQQISKTVLIAPSLPQLLKTADNPEGIDQALFDGVAQHLEMDRAQFWHVFFRDYYSYALENGQVSMEMLEWSRHQAMQAGLRPVLACLDSFSTSNLAIDLAALTMPTLLIHGSADKIIPINISSHRIQSLQPKARLIEYKAAPHGLLASHKDQLIVDILEFLRTTTTS